MLSLAALEHAQKWEQMNRKVTHATVVAVTLNAAIIVYEQDRTIGRLFYYIPKGEQEAIEFYDSSAIPQGNQRFRSRVEMALNDWEKHLHEAEKNKLYQQATAYYDPK